MMSNFQARKQISQKKICGKIVKVAFLCFICSPDDYLLRKSDLCFVLTVSTRTAYSEKEGVKNGKKCSYVIHGWSYSRTKFNL